MFCYLYQWIFLLYLFNICRMAKRKPISQLNDRNWNDVEEEPEDVCLCFYFIMCVCHLHINVYYIYI